VNNFNETLACQQEIERLYKVNRALVYIDMVTTLTTFTLYQDKLSCIK